VAVTITSTHYAYPRTEGWSTKRQVSLRSRQAAAAAGPLADTLAVMSIAGIADGPQIDNRGGDV